MPVLLPVVHVGVSSQLLATLVHALEHTGSRIVEVVL